MKIKYLLFLSMFFLLNCNQQKYDDSTIYINVINDSIRYNKDAVRYYIVNKTDDEICLYLNKDFFKRQKDSLILDANIQSKIEIFKGENIIKPSLFAVYFKSDVADSLNKVNKEIRKVEKIANINKFDLAYLEKYKKNIKSNDSILITTKINFENDARFYDTNEMEGYILSDSVKYTIRFCINTDLNKKLKPNMVNKSLYTEEICSKIKNIKWVKSVYK